MFVSELRERALSEFRQSDPEIQDRHRENTELSIEMNRVLKVLNTNQRQVIEKYMDKTNSLVCCEFDYLYLQGIKDGFKLVKMLNLI